MRMPPASVSPTRASVIGLRVDRSSRSRPTRNALLALDTTDVAGALGHLTAVDDLGVEARSHVGERLAAVERLGTGLGHVEARVGVERRMLRTRS